MLELPLVLDERTERHGEPREGDFVVYWMRMAVRGHDNPALEVAIQAADRLGLPVFVYWAISERYPYANDRLHTFALEGVRDAARELADRGIALAAHVQRAGHRGRHLESLARRAALVVTEDVPVAPFPRWTATVRAVAPVWEVDASCIVPPRLLGRGFTRAFRYRDAAEPYRVDRIGRRFAGATPTRSTLPDLPFIPVDLEGDLAALVGACTIDHGIGPVPHTRGGARAGYARWEAFVSGGHLKRYARTRNDPTRPEGVSRMSAYLHWGHVSPFRIAEDADGEGARKYLDELLTWRELAWTWCRYTPDHDRVSALPQWARSTLSAHEGDPRTLRSWETLARGRTGDPLWDAAQHSLLRHGEIHNNVRMTWGKAFIGWTPDAATAYTAMTDLNHRYALDGRDPASYGGLIWCLGGLDRPFSPELPVIGRVRPRGTARHAKRLDVRAYATHCRRPLRDDPPRVAVVGAGVAGSIAARTLADHGYAVDVFDKGRGPGGRLSSRRAGDLRFDHGAPYLTARDSRFARYVHSWAADGVVAPWTGRAVTFDGEEVRESRTDATRWVGVGKMNAVVAHLQADLEVAFGVRVSRVDADGTLHTADGTLGRWDAVVLTAPAPQAAELVREAAPGVAERLDAVRYAPCWAAMVQPAASLDLDFDAARFTAGPLGFAARQDTRPGRRGPETWVLHGSRAWSREHLEDDKESVAAALWSAFCAATDRPDAQVHLTAHRWRYALIEEPVGADVLTDGCITVAGDALLGARIEAAWLSGVAAAGTLLRRFAAEAPAHRPVQGSLL